MWDQCGLSWCQLVRGPTRTDRGEVCGQPCWSNISRGVHTDPASANNWSKQD